MMFLKFEMQSTNTEMSMMEQKHPHNENVIQLTKTQTFLYQAQYYPKLQ